MTRRLVVAFVALALVSSACSSDRGGAPRVEDVAATTAVDFDYEIPAGTAVALAAGRQSSIFPEELDAKVGQVIRIVNDDDRGHTVGPFFVAARSTVVQRFASAGVFTGTCSVHLDDRFVLKVTA